MKKTLVLLLATVMVFAVTSCAKKVNNSQAADNVPTLTWYVQGDKQTDIRSVMDAANNIIEPAIGAKLDLQFIDSGAYQQRMTMLMASGTAYDLCFTGYTNSYNVAVQKGGLLELDELIEKQAPDIMDLIPDYWIAAARRGEKLYAIPNVQGCALPIALFIDKKISEKYHFDFSKVKTINDIEPYLEMVKKGDPDIYPYRTNFNVVPWYTNVYENLDCECGIKKDGSSYIAQIIQETPEYYEGVKKLREWYQKGYIRSDVATVGDDTQDCKAGKYAVSNDAWKPGVENDFKNSTGREYLAVIIETPFVATGNCIQSMTGIGASSKNPEKSIKFIELINKNKELYNLICYGIKDKHYSLSQENKLKYIKDSGYYLSSGSWKFGNQFNSSIIDNVDSNIWEETKKMNDEAKKSRVFGFVIDRTNLTTELAQMSTVTSEYSGFRNGTRDLNDWDTYLQKRTEAGVGKMQKEVQRQLDEYVKNKK